MQNRFREDFKLFRENKNLVYLDNAATTQRPDFVIDRVIKYYTEENANPLRGVYDLSVSSTKAYEGARETVRKFIGAEHLEEIIFTRNATESLNLIAKSYGDNFLKEGDEVLLTVMEHHSNLLPWQELIKKGIKLVFLYPDEEGIISREEIDKKITNKTKLVSIAHISNVIGIKNPIEEIIEKAHQRGAIVVVDGAQAAPHIRVDVKKLGADFYVFSGHKMLAPMGIGVLYGRLNLLKEMPPFLTGGEMIEYVELESATYAPVPYKFEAGTMNVGGAVGLAAAIDYLERVGFDFISKTEDRLTKIMYGEMSKLPYIKIMGKKGHEDHSGIISFVVDGVHPHDAASIFAEEGICVRAGHHCAQPFIKYMGQIATLRASLYFYNTEEEVYKLIETLPKIRRLLGYGT